MPSGSDGSGVDGQSRSAPPAEKILYTQVQIDMIPTEVKRTRFILIKMIKEDFRNGPSPGDVQTDFNMLSYLLKCQYFKICPIDR